MLERTNFTITQFSDAKLRVLIMNTHDNIMNRLLWVPA